MANATKLQATIVPAVASYRYCSFFLMVSVPEKENRKLFRQ